MQSDRLKRTELHRSGAPPGQRHRTNDNTGAGCWPWLCAESICVRDISWVVLRGRAGQGLVVDSAEVFGGKPSVRCRLRREDRLHRTGQQSLPVTGQQRAVATCRDGRHGEERRFRTRRQKQTAAEDFAGIAMTYEEDSRSVVSAGFGPSRRRHRGE